MVLINQPAFLLEALGWNPFSSHFQLLEATCIPWLLTPSSIFKVSKEASLPLSWTLTLLPPSSKDPCNCMESTRVTQDNLSSQDP